jgi:hypothetical protein
MAAAYFARWGRGASPSTPMAVKATAVLDDALDQRGRPSLAGADQMAHRDGVSNLGKDTYGNAASFTGTDTFVGLSHCCDIIWVDEAAEVVVRTVNARRVALKTWTRKNVQNLVRK